MHHNRLPSTLPIVSYFETSATALVARLVGPAGLAGLVAAEEAGVGGGGLARVGCGSGAGWGVRRRRQRQMSSGSLLSSSNASAAGCQAVAREAGGRSCLGAGVRTAAGWGGEGMPRPPLALTRCSCKSWSQVLLWSGVGPPERGCRLGAGG